jgi:hypothetical protein
MPGSRPSAAIPLVTKTNEGPMSESRAPLMPVRPEGVPSSRRGPASSPHGSTNDGIARSRNFVTDPPPELDGSKRRRLITYFFAAFAIAAAAIAFSVYRSQIRPVPAAQPEASTPSGPAPIEPPVVTTAAPMLTAAATNDQPAEEAVDPGKLKHPVSSAKPAPPRGSFKKKKRPNDGTVDIPDPPDEE